MESNNEVSTKKYIGLFTLLYASIMTLFNILLHGFDVDLGSGANTVMLMAASLITSNKFVTINKRAPKKAEKNKLIFGCLLSSFAISILGVIILISIALGAQGFTGITRTLPKLPALAWLTILIAVTLLYYFMLNLSFGWYANRYATKISTKDAI